MITPHPAVCRLLIEAGQVANYGSGTLIKRDGDRCAILTCAHLFLAGRVETVTACFPYAPFLRVHLHAISRDCDLAILTADSGAADLPTITQPVELAPRTPRPGEGLFWSGYNTRGEIRMHSGTLRGYCRLSRAEGCCMMALNGIAEDGNSGGPIFTKDGKLAGVIWGTDDASAYGTWAGNIRPVTDL